MTVVFDVGQRATKVTERTLTATSKFACTSPFEDVKPCQSSAEDAMQTALFPEMRLLCIALNHENGKGVDPKYIPNISKINPK